MDTYNGYLGALGFSGTNDQQQQPASGSLSPAGSDTSGALTAPQTQVPQANGATSFAQSDAARQISDTQRQLALSKAELAQAGTEERQGINYGYEDRGLFNSGIRGQALAQQQGREANKAAQLEAGAASDVGNINANMQRQLAAQQAAQQQTAADQQLQNMQLQYMQSQFGTQQNLAAQQLQFQQQQEQAQEDYWKKMLAAQQQAATGNGG